MRLINLSLWMRVLLITTQLTMDGPGPYMVERLPGKPFLLWQEVSQAKQGEISSELIHSSQGTLYCLHYLSMKVSSTVTSLKALSTWQASTNLLSIPSTVCNPLQSPTW